MISNSVQYRLAIVCTHPIQYYAPVFKQLSSQPCLRTRVYFGWSGATERSLDHGFGQQIQWDIPLLDGYDFEFVENVARDPGSHHYRGIDLPKLCERIEDWQADAVLVYGWSYKAHLAAMRYFKDRIPVFFRGDSTLLDETSALRAFVRRRLLSWVYRHIDMAFAVGSHNRNYFLAHGLRESQIVQAPHAIDNARFAAAASERGGRIRSTLGIPESSVLLLFAGKLETKKAPDLLLDAFQQLDGQDAHLAFVGTGPLESALRAKAGDRVHFLGFQNQSQMPSVYADADLLALPSRGPGETWGLALNEAMACGRAVLASDRVGAAVDLVSPRSNGWIVTANDVVSLVTALREAVAIGRPGLQQYGQASAATISRWSIPIQASVIANTVAQQLSATHNA